ncbi:unnamed protein product [Phytomonas sp. Hart1]|nr:unnamed protein product [Phytomonas sp. Hart1]|eukprot:CCW66177.1 unnamed protein product [Phytomonas sp. isolate Hart1]
MSSSDIDEYDPGLKSPNIVSENQVSLGDTAAQHPPTTSDIFTMIRLREPNTSSTIAFTKAQAINNITLDSQVKAKNMRFEENKGASALYSQPVDAGEYGLRLHGIKGRTRCICLSPNGFQLCAGGEDGQLLMWDFTVALKSRRIEPTRVLTPFVNRISGYQPIIALHAAVDGSYFVACQDGDSPALITSGGKQLGYCAIGERGMVDVVQCKGHRAAVTSSCCHATVAGSFYTCAQDGTARLWEQGSYERRSVYAVKHGSGQIDDVVIVESVLSLTSVGGGGSVFATGGQDGCVQLWDSRTKYRPGGSVISFDLYAPQAQSSHACKKALEGDDLFEKHVGGMAELTHLSGITEPTPAVLAVRRNAQLQLVDLRRLLPPQKRIRSATASFSLAPSPPPLFGDPIMELPYMTDTTPVIATPDGFLTCTSRNGYRHVVGGHVVHFQCGSNPASSHVIPPLQVWRAGRPDEDVLCVCADVATLGSSSSGGIFAGLNSGDVVVQTAVSGDNRLDKHDAPFWRWLATRPEPEKGSGKTDCRSLGQKSGRIQGDEYELLY